MKRSKLTSYFSNLRKESAKNVRPSQLRLESLEARQLLSVTDVATLAAASEAEQPAAYTTVAPVSDAVIDVSSVLVTTAAQRNADDIAAINSLGLAATQDDAIFRWSDATGRLIGIDFTKWNPLSPSNSVEGRSFDLTVFPELKGVTATDCGIASLTVANLTKLETLYVSGNAFDSLDVSGCSALYNLQCGANNISSLNLTGSALTILSCESNALTELDLSATPSLTALSCYDNPLTVIDATPCANLRSLEFYDGALETVYVNHNADVTMQLYVKKSECDLSVVDADLNEITTTASENYFQFTLGAAAANPITATVTFRNANGATQKIEIDPYIKLDATEGSVYAVVSENVDLTGMSIFGMADPTFKVSVAGYTVEESAEFVKVEDNTLIYVGGLASSATPYNVSVTVEDGDAVDSAEFALTVEQYKLAAPVELTVSSFDESSVSLAWEAGDVYAESYTVEVYAGGELIASQTTGETSYTAAGLDANTAYTFNVKATGDDLEDSEYATVEQTTDKATLAAPTNLAATATDSTVTLTWDAVEGATAYVIEGYGETADTTFTVSDLDANTAYTFNVKATADDKYDSEFATVTVTTDKATLAAPTDFAADATESAVTLTWTAVEGATAYVIDGYGETTDTTFTVSDLDANTEYTFNVKATADDKYDSEFATVSVRTDMATLATPEDFAVVGATESSIDLTWSAVEYASGYTVDIIDGETVVSTLSVSEAAATFEDLDANTEYTFRVQATTLGMNPSDYAYVTGHTDMATLAAPTNLAATATDSTVTLTWDAVEGATVYVIEGYGETADTTFTVSDLDANTEYTFSVVATADGMYPSAAAAVAVTTEKATLAAPTDLAATADVTSVTLTWTAVEGATAYVIDGYGETSDTTFTAYDLAPETEYTFNVKATADGMNDSEFATVTVTTEAEPVIVYAIELSASEKTVADSAADVKLADVTLTGYTDAAEFAVTVNGDASEAVAVVDGKLVYAGGLEASETAYAITVTVSEGEQTSSAEFALTVMEVVGPAITLSTDSPLVGGRVTTTLDPAGAATYQWYVGESVDSMTLTTIKSSYFTPNANQLGKYLKVVATYTSGDYAGVSVEAISSDVIKRTVTGVTFAKVVPYAGKEVFAYTTPVAATADIQWYRVASDGTEEAIEGANTRYYTPTDADITYSLKVVAIGTGFYVGEASAITQVPVVAENPLTLSTTSPILGHRITTKLNPADSFSSWQWYRDSGTDWVSINGATYSYYTPSYIDVGHKLRVVATYARGANKELSTSAYTDPVMRGVISVTIKGDDDLQIGTALTTKVQGPAATVEYQWYRGANASGDAWTAIPDATEAGYTATEADAGYYLKVVATGVGEYAGFVEDVTAKPVYIERLVVSTDSPALGDRVTATVVPGDYYAKYQWSLVDANGKETAISTATASYFTPSYNHVGYWLKVTATYTRGDFAGQTFSKVSENPIARKLGQVTVTPGYAFVGTQLKAYHIPTYATVDIQWYRVDSEGNETAVEGANSLTYTPTAEDVGYAMKVVVTGTGSYFGESSATSAVVQARDAGNDLGDEISEALLDTLALAIL